MADIPAEDHVGSYLTASITSIVASVTVIVAVFYLTGLFFLSQRMPKDNMPVNKCSTFRLQRSVPFVYMLVVFSSLVEVSVSSWLIGQYASKHNYPSLDSRKSVCVTLACACWTCVTAGAYLVLSFHPSWRTLPISSIGAQAVWILITWIFWVTATAVIDKALPSIIISGNCGLIYCGQLQVLFAIAVLQIVVLTLAMFIVIWLAWMSIKGH